MAKASDDVGDNWDDFVQTKVTYRDFSVPPEDDLPGPGEFQLTTSQNCLSPEDDFKQIVL